MIAQFVNLVLASILILGALGFSQDAYATSFDEIVKLIASDAAISDTLDHISVSISGDRAIVGAFANDDACPSDINCNSGSAYIFERDSGGSWSEVSKLLASDAADGDNFGFSVSISGDRAIVGAFNNDDLGGRSGSAYIFERDLSGSWSEVTKLLASDGGDAEQFGDSVSISGDRAIVGARFADGVITRAGSAYIFERDSGGSWSEVAKLSASDGQIFALFGISVSISDDRAIVGARQHKDVLGQVIGSAYIFERDLSGSWSEVSKLLASDAAAGDIFGDSVSISDDRAIVGAFGNDDAGAISGSAYIFERDSGGSWSEVSKLLASDAAAGDQFGFSVSISGDRAIVGADRVSNAGEVTAGAAYIFERDSGGSWSEVAKLLASDAAAGDHFGFSVSISGDTAIVGARGDDDAGFESGSAYVFGPSSIPVDIDIKPGSDPNCFNNDGHGVIPVAILGSDTFDATTVNPITVILDSQAVKTKGNGDPQTNIEDVNGDGFDDLIVKIIDEDGTYEQGSSIAILTGELFDGTSIEGTDSICITQ